MAGLVPVRHPVAPRAQHPVDGACGNNLLIAGFGGHDFRDQRIDYRIRDTSQILRSFGGRIRG
jgi:hypothetical protein